jgi:hypothetical protein
MAGTSIAAIQERQRNPLIDVVPSGTAKNIADALDYMMVADAHIADASVLGESAENGRFRIMDCIRDAACALSHELEQKGAHDD